MKKPETARPRLKMALRLRRKKRGAAYQRKRRGKRWGPRRLPPQRKKKKATLPLTLWLANTGRQVDYIRGDGNCFFRALSKEMYGSEDFHVDWRDAVCDLISNYPKVFSPFVDGCCVEAHVHLMRKLGSWATSCEIYGAATLLRREVYVLAPSPSGEKEYHWLLFRPRSLACKSRSGSGGEESEEDDEDEEEDEGGVHPCYITFCLTNGNHYDRITPLVAGVCNCQMDPPFLNGEPLRAEFCPREEEVVSQRDVCWWPS